MLYGSVKWFNDAKGFGFIEPEEGGPDVFAHFSAIEMDGFRTLKQGSRVSYELMQGPKGALAQHIRSTVAAGGPAAAPVAAHAPQHTSQHAPQHAPQEAQARQTA